MKMKCFNSVVKFYLTLGSIIFGTKYSQVDWKAMNLFMFYMNAV